MQTTRTLTRMNKLQIPYDENMDISIECGNEKLDIQTIRNNQTVTFHCMKVSKYLMKQCLFIRFFEALEGEVKISYQNNVSKAKMYIDQEAIDLNLNDSKMIVHALDKQSVEMMIESNDLVIDEAVVIELENEGQQLQEENQLLEQRYQSIQEQLSTLQAENMHYQEQMKNMKFEIEELKKKIAIAKEIFEQSEQSILQEQFNVLQKKYHFTEAILEEYEGVANYSNMQEEMENAKGMIDHVEETLSKHIIERNAAIKRIKDRIRK